MNYLKKIKIKIKHSYYNISSLLLINGELYCPICDRSFNKMNPHVGTYFIKGDPVDHFTKDAHCPSCNLDLRHRFFYAVFKKMYSSPSNINLLHFAPEYPIYKIFKKLIKNYTPADIDPSLYYEAEKIDATNTNLPSQFYDVVIFNHILQFIKEDQLAIKELARILKPGGTLFIAVPLYGEKTSDGNDLSPNDRNLQFGAPHHLRMYGKDVKEMIAKEGFEITEYDFYKDMPYLVKIANKSPHSDSDRYLFVCKKT